MQNINELVVFLAGSTHFIRFLKIVAACVKISERVIVVNIDSRKFYLFGEEEMNFTKDELMDISRQYEYVDELLHKLVESLHERKQMYLADNDLLFNLGIGWDERQTMTLDRIERLLEITRKKRK